MMSLHLHVNQKSDYGDSIFQKFLSGIQSESQTVLSQIKSHIEPDLGQKVIRSLQKSPFDGKELIMYALTKNHFKPSAAYVYLLIFD